MTKIFLNSIATVQSSAVIAFTSFIAPITLSPTFLGLGVTTIVSSYKIKFVSKVKGAVHKIDITEKARFFVPKFSNQFFFICLDQISGWGATTADKTVQPVHLQVASVTTINCTINDFITFTNDHICAGGSGVGICTNDVGGPMVLNSMLVGIPFFHDPRVCGGQSTPPIPVSNFFKLK